MHVFNYSHRRLIGITAALALILITPQIALAQATGTTAYGNGALGLTTSAGQYNSAFGANALYDNTDGTFNTAVGAYALHNNIGGDKNTALGVIALSSNNSGYENTASGQGTLYYNTNGYENTASGTGALYSNIGGWGNTALGNQALYNNISGHNNVAMGYQAGINLKGSNNVAIQNAGDSGDNNTIRIGDAQNRAFIAAISGNTVSGGVQVYINSDGQLGTTTSSQRFKKEIKSIDAVSDKLLQLRPVSFIYKEDEKNELQYGLIAEEVAKVYPELVQYDKEGKPFTVYYHLLTPLLLSELQKEHEQVASQQTQLTDMQAVAVQQQAKLDSREQQLSTQHAEMLALLQQQRQQHVAEMTALQQRLTQLDELLQASNTSHQSSARVAMTSSH